MTTATAIASAPSTLSAVRSGDAAAAPTASELWGMIRRRMVLCVALTMLFGALAVSGFFFWWYNFPGYRSECLIECVTNLPEAELSVEQQRLRQDEYERFVRTQATLLKSPSILGEALKISAVRETKWFDNVRQRGREPLLDLTEDLVAAPLRGTNLLRVAMEFRNKEDPATIVNEVVSQWYFTVKRKAADELVTAPLESAQKEMEDLERSIAQDRERLKSISTRLPPGAVQNPAANITAQEVRQYGEQVAQLELELAQLEQYRAIYSNPESLAVTAEDRAMVEQDPQVAELSRALYLLEQQRSADGKVYGPGHSVLRAIDAQIDSAKERLAEIRVERLRERRSDVRDAAETAYNNTQYSLFLARENLAKAEAGLADQDALLFEYFDLEKKIEEKNLRRIALEDYIRTLTRVKTQRSAITVNITQPAVPALERSSPNILLLPVGVVFSFMLSVGIVLGLELMDKSVRTPQDVARHLDLPVLGVIPDTDDEEVAIERVETSVRDAPRSMIAEAFRRMRTSLQFSAPADRQKTLLVTSPRPEDGASSVAANLALVLAQAGQRVLLVDANLRRPRLQQVFEGVAPQGLSNLLIGEGSLKQIVAPGRTPGLDVLGSGPLPPNPVELLGGDRCRAVLKDAASQYDHVVIDTAPVLIASDALVLARAVDGVVVVIRANENTRGIARRAVSQLQHVGAHVFGAVLNAAQVTRGGYFREQLRTYYEYQAEATTMDRA